MQAIIPKLFGVAQTLQDGVHETLWEAKAEHVKRFSLMRVHGGVRGRYREDIIPRPRVKIWVRGGPGGER